MSNLPPITHPSQIDTSALLGQSRPGGNVRRLGLIVPGAWGLVLAAAVMGRPAGVQTTLTLVAIAATAATSLLLRSAGRRAERERTELAKIEDQLALKQTPQALASLVAILSTPMRTAENRLRGLLLLATALARTDRQDDALVLYDELLDQEHIVGPGEWTVRLARAMALLRADRLYDADQAISDLRRQLGRSRPMAATESLAGEDTDFSEAPADAARPAPESPMYAATRLVELYRDVKTGHPADAIVAFETDRQALRDGLGHRFAEALALVAAAHDRLQHPSESQTYFTDATALLPLPELLRKYPELAALSSKCAATAPPPRLAS